jgi:hypothetical protein
MVRNYDTTLTDDEIKSNLTLIGLSGGLMIDSDDLTRLSVERQSWVSLLTPVLSSGGRPLDLLEKEMAELYDLPVKTPWGEWHDVAVFNWDGRPASRLLKFERLGYPEGAKLSIFDFWSGRHWTTQDSELVLDNVASHGCRLLRICLTDDRPMLVGDTLHITQGGEIESWQVEGKTLEIKTIGLERNAQGALWVKLPGKLTSAKAGPDALSPTQENDGVYKLELKFQGKSEIKIQWE